MKKLVQLLHKLSIRATNGPDKLMKVIKNPVTDHLPSGSHKIGKSFPPNHNLTQTFPCRQQFPITQTIFKLF